MKLCSFRRGDALAVGVVRDDEIVDVSSVAARSDGALPTTMLGWIDFGAGAVDALGKLAADATGDERVDLAGAELVSPIPEPRRSAFCVAANYRDHVLEAVAAAAARGQVIDADAYLRADPSYFTKDPRAMCGPFDDIVVDLGYSAMVDWEVELAVVVGAAAEDVDEGDALAHVFGYATFNDLSLRDIQRSRGQMWKGKNFRRGSPLGPYLVTADELDPGDLGLRCWVNGELMQEGRTSSMIHGVARLVSDLSRGFTLEPGDVIATGTTVGTGHSQDPPRFLRPGDVLETEVEGLGRQRNRIAGAVPA